MTLHQLAVTATEGSRLDTMVRLFLVAALIISPFAFSTVRRLRADRWARRSPGDTDEAPPPGHDIDPGDLGLVITQIDDAPDRFDADGIDELIIAPAAGLTLDGRPVDDTVVAALVADAAARSGVEVVRDPATTPPRFVVRRRTG